MSKWRGVSFAKAIADLTTAYASGWVSGWIDIGDAKEALLKFIYTHADATTVDFKVEVEDIDGTVGFELWRPSGLTLILDEVKAATSALPKTPAGFGVIVPTISFRRFRVRLKHTGGSGTNRMSMDVLAGDG